MNRNKINIKNILLIICLITVAVAWRIINHNYQIAPNLELVTVVSVLAAVTLSWRAALIVPITAMIISDIVIGNSSIFMFTWGTFAVIGVGAVLLRKLNDKPKMQILSSLGFAAVSSCSRRVRSRYNHAGALNDPIDNHKRRRHNPL